MLPKSFLFPIGILLSINISAQYNPKLDYGKVKDIEGNIYKTITIGTQTWMQENLRVTTYRDGSKIPVVTDSVQWSNNWNKGKPLQRPMMCWHSNDQRTYTANKFGALYNWYAINPATNGNKKICPTGWHVPSDAEWTTFINYLDPIADGGENGDNTVGIKMKSTGTNYWKYPNLDANNSSGFTGFPGGYRNDDGKYSVIGNYGIWWSSKEKGTDEAWVRYLYNDLRVIDRGTEHKSYGLSVRCLKD
jgi:uncharacterized protein (TIGR02145 family)